jgi:hypothetical protein
MKKYYFSYVEVVQNHKSIEIDLDDEDPQQFADSLLHLRDYIQWDEEGEITQEFDIQFCEVTSVQE